MTTLGQRAYRLFVEYRSWIAVAREVYGNDDRDYPTGFSMFVPSDLIYQNTIEQEQKRCPGGKQQHKRKRSHRDRIKLPTRRNQPNKQG